MPNNPVTMTYEYKLSNNPRLKQGPGSLKSISGGNKMSSRIQSFANNNTATSVSGCQSCSTCVGQVSALSNGSCNNYCNNIVGPDIAPSFYCNYP